MGIVATPHTSNGTWKRGRRWLLEGQEEWLKGFSFYKAVASTHMHHTTSTVVAHGGYGYYICSRCTFAVCSFLWKILE